MIQITFQRHKCIGCGSCIEVAPSRWEMSNIDGKSVLLEGKQSLEFYHLKTTDDEFEESKEAADLCPVNIIKVKHLKK
ncbi:ferredoxin [Bacteroidota bacterium]